MYLINVCAHGPRKTEPGARPESGARKVIGTVVLLAAVVSLAGPRPGYAQSTATTEDQQTTQSGQIEQVVVTGSRIGRTDGYEAPTPVTVLGEVAIDSFASANIADVVNTLPVFSGSQTPGSSIQNVTDGDAAMNVLNLRDLGTNRTLVLLDGRRIVPSHLDGAVDINNIPQGLVSRVEVVTGGASAVYGSGAVGGVANFILNTDYTGLKGSAAGGVTSYGDRENWQATLTGGTEFAEDRGHIVMSASVRDAAGISVNRRPWNLTGWQFMYNPKYTPTNGLPERILLDHVGTSDGIVGGIITTTALRGTAFGPGGEPYQFEYGDLVFDPDMHGGDWEKGQVRGTAAGQTLAPEISNQNFFTHVKYQLSDATELFAEASINHSETYNWGYTYECNGCFTIKAGNPYIPASIAAQMDALGITEFQMGTQNVGMGVLATDGDHTITRFLVGANGLFEAFDTDWDWDVYYQRGISKHHEIADNATYLANVDRAIDAVIDPDTGEIVCRSTLTDPTNGCAPYNPMGLNMRTQAAYEYVTGAGIDAFRDSKFTEDAAAATIAGEPFSSWAGLVSVAAGVEYRKDAASGVNDPISDIRGWYIGGYGVATGSVSVSEAYLETVVPLARDAYLAQSLDLNAAVRASDYSTSGQLTTWKVGATYRPIDSIMFRVTQSRDARAPNLSELISEGAGGLGSAVNPFTGENLFLIPTPRTGNLNLQPELADTLGIGIVLQPSFLPEFSASVDYWSIEIEDAIGTLPLQEILDRCYLGNEQFCEALTFTPGTQDIVQVRRSPFNFVFETAKGIDIEATYRTPFWNGDLAARLVASHYIERTTDDGTGPVRDVAGENDGSGPPNWRWNARLDYVGDPLSMGLVARGVSHGVYDNRFIECSWTCPTSTPAHRTTSENDISSQVFFDASFGYQFAFHDTELNLFLNVRNLFDSDPTVVADGPGADGYFYSPANFSLYDYLGRVYRAGVRVEF